MDHTRSGSTEPLLSRTEHRIARRDVGQATEPPQWDAWLALHRQDLDQVRAALSDALGDLILGERELDRELLIGGLWKLNRAGTLALPVAESLRKCS